MKNIKIFAAILLSVIMMVSIVACGNKTEDNNGTTNEPEVNDKVEVKDIIPEVDENTMGGIMWNTFVEACKTNTTAETITTAISENSGVQFAPMVMEVEPGLLTGFDNNEITGFKSGYTFSPMIGTIPFVSYVFELEEGADAEPFVNTLKESSNPAWNICTEAEQTVAGTNGNFVFFVMCPESMEQ